MHSNYGDKDERISNFWILIFHDILIVQSGFKFGIYYTYKRGSVYVVRLLKRYQSNYWIIFLASAEWNIDIRSLFQ